MAEDWVCNANNKFEVEAQNWRDIEEALGIVNHEKTQLAKKFKVAESACQSVEAGLKNAEAQAKD